MTIDGVGEVISCNFDKAGNDWVSIVDIRPDKEYACYHCWTILEKEERAAVRMKDPMFSLPPKKQQKYKKGDYCYHCRTGHIVLDEDQDYVCFNCGRLQP